VKRVLRSAYLDTNVFLAAHEVSPLRAPSRAAIELASSGIVTGVGSPLLRKEIRRASARLGLAGPLVDYPSAIVVELSAGRENSRLAGIYAKSLGIKLADASHLAFAVVGRVDVLVSWNREDLVRQSTRERLERVNATIGLPVPRMVTPSQLLAMTRKGPGRSRLFWI
jgi:predicted nucleic acid-binding protein